MRIKLAYVSTFFAVGAAAAAIAASPTAMADPTPVPQYCVYLGVSETQCQSPGNVQINDNPGYVQYTSQYPSWQSDAPDHRGRP